MTQRTTKHAEGDAVNHPDHYNAHPSGIECIEVIRHMPHNLGAATKYIWRLGLKGDPTEDGDRDLEKAIWYLRDELERRQEARKKES